MTAYQHIQVPPAGQNITVNADQTLNVPDQPIIPFIEGDGVGVDVTPVMRKVVDAAVAKIYGGKRKIHWMESMPARSHPPVRPRHVAARGNHGRGARLSGVHQGAADHAGGRRHPLAERGAAPGAGPVRLPAPGAYFKGVPSPLKEPEKTNMVIFRENSEDIYAGHRIRSRQRPRES
jgi:isocitrate dehydrogenase